MPIHGWVVLGRKCGVGGPGGQMEAPVPAEQGICLGLASSRGPLPRGH